MRPWQFSKPKSPGFGISKSFYLSVLSSRAVMPPILQVVDPNGEGGAAIGFGAPLAGDNRKTRLTLPMERGAYVVASRDRKTVLKMLVLSKEEAGYDPEAFAYSSRAVDADPELLARLRATWSLAQFTFESHDAMVYPALDFLLGVCARLAELSDGLIADPISQRYLLPYQVFCRNRRDPRIDSRDHIVIRQLVRPDGIHAFTLGMQKFGLPEIEINGLTDASHEIAESFLQDISQRMLTGDIVEPGRKYGSGRDPFEARIGGFDRSLWEGIQVLELRPPIKSTADEALSAWAEAR